MRRPAELADAPRTWRQLQAETAEVLGSPADARWLIEEASGYHSADLVVHLDEPATARSGAYLTAMVERRAGGEPLQYVLGRWGFRHLDLMVDRRVLIPRPETEQVVGWALDSVEERGRPLLVADLGTGSGAIALSLATELPTAEVWATDVSADALDVARANLAGLGGTAATRVRLAAGSWWDALPPDLAGRLDLVVSNPPYVGEHDPLPVGVDAYEPRIALRSGPSGMDAISAIIGGAAGWLAPGGVLVVELAPAQAATTATLAAAAGATGTRIRIDALLRQRALVAQW